MAHTPGPWKVNDNPFASGNDVVIGHDDALECPGFGGSISYTDVVCSVPWTGGVHANNARLIAAAPDLLEALEWFVEASTDGAIGDPSNSFGVNQARAAIAKARGE
jgi:hypothetical protein